MGLSIAAQLVSLLEGRIGVISNAGAGSTFWLEIPYMMPVAEMVDKNSKDQNQINRKLHVLLVDDNKLNQQIVDRFLRNRGHLVKIAQSGQEALKNIQEDVFDVILMDLHMPGMDGIDTTKAIKKLGGHSAQIPIIALTANVLEEKLSQCRAAGMVDYIAKPIDREAFFMIIARHVMYDPAGFSVHAKAVEINPAHLNSKIRAVYEEFGPDYAVYFIKDNFQEIEKLIEEVSSCLGSHDYQGVCRAAHNLISISGNIGMEQVSNLSSTIEKSVSRREFDEIPFIFQQLTKSFQRESKPFRGLMT